MENTKPQAESSALESFSWTELLNEYAHRCGLLGVAPEGDALVRASTAAAEVRIEINSRINRVTLGSVQPKRINRLLAGGKS